jgi:urease accessory protein
MLRATTYLAARDAKTAPFDHVTLVHDERRLRRKLLTLARGDEVLVDFPFPTTLGHGDRLVLEDGRTAEVIAAPELLHEITGADPSHLVRLAWHLGNRHLPAQLEDERILIKRDHVIRDMLIGLGATVSDVSEPFFPEHGAYHSHGDASHALLNHRHG